MNIKNQIKGLENNELNKLYDMSKENISKKIILMICCAGVGPLFILSVYNNFNNIEVIKTTLIVTILILILRYFFNNKILENIVIIIFAFLYCYLLSSIGINLRYLMIIIMVTFYFIASKVIKITFLQSWINNILEKKEVKFKKNHTLILSCGVLIPPLLGSGLENTILIFFSYFFSILAISNSFNTYYLKEQEEEMIRRNIIKS